MGRPGERERRPLAAWKEKSAPRLLVAPHLHAANARFSGKNSRATFQTAVSGKLWACSGPSARPGRWTRGRISHKKRRALSRSPFLPFFIRGPALPGTGPALARICKALMDGPWTTPHEPFRRSKSFSPYDIYRLITASAPFVHDCLHCRPPTLLLLPFLVQL